MSINLLKQVWGLRFKKLNSGSKLVLLALVDYANDDGNCWPSIKALSEKCNMDRSTVIEHIKKLEAIGLVVKRYRHDKKGYRRSSCYSLTLDKNQSLKTPRRENQYGENPRGDLPQSKVGNPDGNDIEPPIEPPIYICKVSNETSPAVFEFNEEAYTEEIKRGTKNNTSKLDLNVQAIFRYWQQVMNHPQAKLDKKRESKIRQALKNYPMDQLKQAIDGCSKTPFNMGSNENKQRYDDISLILRDASHIEQFIANNSSQTDISKNDVTWGAI